MPLQAGSISQGAGTGFTMGRSPLSQNIQKMMQMGISEGGANQRAMIAAGYQPSGGFKGWGKQSMDEIYGKLKDYTGAGHDVDITMGNAKIKLKGKKDLTEQEMWQESIKRATNTMTGDVDWAVAGQIFNTLKTGAPPEGTFPTAGGGPEAEQQAGGGGFGAKFTEGMGNLADILGGIRDKLQGRATQQRTGGAKFALPANVKTTSQAMQYLTSVVGLSEAEAQQWIRTNATAR